MDLDTKFTESDIDMPIMTDHYKSNFPKLEVLKVARKESDYLFTDPKSDLVISDCSSTYINTQLNKLRFQAIPSSSSKKSASDISSMRSYYRNPDKEMIDAAKIMAIQDFFSSEDKPL